MKNKIGNSTDRNFVIFDISQGWNEHNRQGGKQKIHYRTTGTGNKIYCGRHKQSVNPRLPHKHHFHTRIHRKLYGLARKKNCQNRQAEIIKRWRLIVFKSIKMIKMQERQGDGSQQRQDGVKAAERNKDSRQEQGQCQKTAGEERDWH